MASKRKHRPGRCQVAGASFGSHKTSSYKCLAHRHHYLPGIPVGSRIRSLKQPGREPGTPRVVCAPSTTAVPALSAYNCYYPKNDSFGSFFDHQKIYDFCIQMRRIYHFLGPFDSYPIHLSHSLISTYLKLLTRGFLDHPATFSAFLFKS